MVANSCLISIAFSENSTERINLGFTKPTLCTFLLLLAMPANGGSACSGALTDGDCFVAGQMRSFGGFGQGEL